MAEAEEESNRKRRHKSYTGLSFRIHHNIIIRYPYVFIYMYICISIPATSTIQLLNKLRLELRSGEGVK